MSRILPDLQCIKKSSETAFLSQKTPMCEFNILLNVNGRLSVSLTSKLGSIETAPEKNS